VSRFALLLSVFLLLPLTAAAQSVGIGVGAGDPHALQGTLREAIEELRSLDDLVDAADSRSVQRELHRKVMRIEELLEDASRLAAHGGGLSASVVVHDPEPVRETIVIVEQPIDPGPVIVVEEHHDPGPVIIVDDGPIACSHADFDGVLRALESESFSSGKLDVLRDASRARWFTVSQVQQLIKSFTFGKDMVEAGAMLHSRTVDLENWYLVYSVFTFDSDKDKLRDRVGR